MDEHYSNGKNYLRLITDSAWPLPMGCLKPTMDPEKLEYVESKNKKSETQVELTRTGINEDLQTNEKESWTELVKRNLQ